MLGSFALGADYLGPVKCSNLKFYLPPTGGHNCTEVLMIFFFFLSGTGFKRSISTLSFKWQPSASLSYLGQSPGEECVGTSKETGLLCSLTLAIIPTDVPSSQLRWPVVSLKTIVFRDGHRLFSKLLYPFCFWL